jgi:hypothetical protein
MSDVEPPIDSHNEEWQKDIYPHINTQITCQEMLQKLCPTYKPSQGLALPPPKMNRTENGKSAYCDYLNRLSSLFQTENSSYTWYICEVGSLDSQCHTPSSSGLMEQQANRHTLPEPFHSQKSWSQGNIPHQRVRLIHIRYTGLIWRQPGQRNLTKTGKHRQGPTPPIIYGLVQT